jgi:hypothetical protein
MSRMYGIYVGIKKLLPKTIVAIPTVGQSDVSLQCPTLTNTTITDHGHSWQKLHPSAPHEALCSNPMSWMDGRQPPEQAGIIIGAVEGVYGPQNTLASSPEQRSALKAIHTLNPPQNYIRKLGGFLTIHSMRRREAQGLMWGEGPAAAMVVAVVMPVVFCATEILKNAINTTISCFYSVMLSLITYCKTY